MTWWKSINHKAIFSSSRFPYPVNLPIHSLPQTIIRTGIPLSQSFTLLSANVLACTHPWSQFRYNKRKVRNTVSCSKIPVTRILNIMWKNMGREISAVIWSSIVIKLWDINCRNFRWIPRGGWEGYLERLNETLILGMGSEAQVFSIIVLEWVANFKTYVRFCYRREEKSNQQKFTITFPISHSDWTVPTHRQTTYHISITKRVIVRRSSIFHYYSLLVPVHHHAEIIEHLSNGYSPVWNIK